MTHAAQRVALNRQDSGAGGASGQPKPQSEAGFTVAQIDTAQYIADMVLELRNMAKGAELYATMVPLEYAYYEAFSVANRVRVPDKEIARLQAIGEDARRAEPKA